MAYRYTVVEFVLDNIVKFVSVDFIGKKNQVILEWLICGILKEIKITSRVMLSSNFQSVQFNLFTSHEAAGW